MKFIEASRSRARFAFLLVFLLLAAGIVCDFLALTAEFI